MIIICNQNNWIC